MIHTHRMKRRSSGIQTQLLACHCFPPNVFNIDWLINTLIDSLINQLISICVQADLLIIWISSIKHAITQVTRPASYHLSSLSQLIDPADRLIDSSLSLSNPINQYELVELSIGLLHVKHVNMHLLNLIITKTPRLINDSRLWWWHRNKSSSSSSSCKIASIRLSFYIPPPECWLFDYWLLIIIYWIHLNFQGLSVYDDKTDNEEEEDESKYQLFTGDQHRTTHSKLTWD